MPRKTNRVAKKRDTVLGLFLVEVVRATHNGELPVNQTIIQERLLERHNVAVSNPTLSRYCPMLITGQLGRKWIRRDGGKQSLDLYSEEETISNSDAIKALMLAFKLIDKDDNLDYEKWVAECSARLGYGKTRCRSFVDEYITCRYAVEFSADRKLLKLNPRTYNQDLFYLIPARDADLRRRPK